jgi:RNA polymerase sigma-70 factor (ECF subfamily)
VPLVRFLSRRTRSIDEAQDVAQEAFVRLWERREDWTAGSARALLFRIGANAAADSRRRGNVRSRWREAGADGNPIGKEPATPEQVVESSEARVRVLRALDALPRKRREVFELVRIEELSYREVAEVLGLAPQTVANHMSLALRDLRAALADLWPTTAAESESRSPDAARPNG